MANTCRSLSPDRFKHYDKLVIALVLGSVVRSNLSKRNFKNVFITGYVFTRFCLSTGGLVSQHALQVSRPTPRGEVEGDLARGVSRSTPKGEVEGDLARGVSRSTPKGEVEGDLARGVSRPTPKGEVEGDLARGGSRPTPKGEVEGDLARGVSSPTPRGVYPSMHWGRPPNGYCCGQYTSYWNAFLSLFCVSHSTGCTCFCLFWDQLCLAISPKEILKMYLLQVMFLHVSVCPRGGGIPACLASFQAHTQGEVEEGSGQGGLQAHTQGEVEGDLARGVSSPTPRGVYPSMHWGRPPPPNGYCCGQYTSYWNAFLFLFCGSHSTGCTCFCLTLHADRKVQWSLHLFLADFTRLYGSAVQWKLPTSPRWQQQNGYLCHFHVIQSVNFLNSCSFWSCLKKYLTESYWMKYFKCKYM